MSFAFESTFEYLLQLLTCFSIKIIAFAMRLIKVLILE